MPVLELIVQPLPLIVSPTGELLLNPPLPGLNRVLLRRLYCGLRVPPVPGVYDAVIDTGAPFALFPYSLWHHQFKWQAGRDFDELSVAGMTAPLTGQVLGHQFTCKLARLRVPVELAGDLKGDRLRLDGLVYQLAETSGPAYIILGLWAGSSPAENSLSSFNRTPTTSRPIWNYDLSSASPFLEVPQWPRNHCPNRKTIKTGRSWPVSPNMAGR